MVLCGPSAAKRRAEKAVEKELRREKELQQEEAQKKIEQTPVTLSSKPLAPLAKVRTTPHVSSSNITINLSHSESGAANLTNSGSTNNTLKKTPDSQSAHNDPKLAASTPLASAPLASVNAGASHLQAKAEEVQKINLSHVEKQNIPHDLFPQSPTSLQLQKNQNENRAKPVRSRSFLPPLQLSRNSLVSQPMDNPPPTLRGPDFTGPIFRNNAVDAELDKEYQQLRSSRHPPKQKSKSQNDIHFFEETFSDEIAAGKKRESETEMMSQLLEEIDEKVKSSPNVYTDDRGLDMPDGLEEYDTVDTYTFKLPQKPLTDKPNDMALISDLLDEMLETEKPLNEDIQQLSGSSRTSHSSEKSHRESHFHETTSTSSPSSTKLNTATSAPLTSRIPILKLDQLNPIRMSSSSLDTSATSTSAQKSATPTNPRNLSPVMPPTASSTAGTEVGGNSRKNSHEGLTPSDNSLMSEVLNEVDK